MTALDQAIEKAGGRVPLAKALGVTRQAVYSWRKQGWVPVPRAIEIEDKFGVGRMRLIKPELHAIVSALTEAR